MLFFKAKIYYENKQGFQKAQKFNIRFVTPGIRKRRKIPWSVQSVIEFYLFFSTRPICILWTVFDRFWRHLDLEILGIPPGGSLGMGKPFCAISMSFFHIFSISPTFNLETANDRYKIPLIFFFRGPPFGVLSPI